MPTSCTVPTLILRALFYAMHILGSSILGNLTCALATQDHRGQPILIRCMLPLRNRSDDTLPCSPPESFSPTETARLFLHQATHSLRRPTSTRQNMWIHQQQNRYPVENAHADWRRYGLSARILRDAAATQVLLPPSQPRSGTRMSYNSIEVALSLARARDHWLERLSTPRRWPIGIPELSVSNEVKALLLAVSSWTEFGQSRCEKDIRSFLKNRKDGLNRAGF